jgi:hypothetical protein
VPFPPAARPTRSRARVAPKLQEKLGGTFVVDNKAGAGGTLGAGAAKRAAPDGYTILVSSLGPFVIGPHLIKNPATTRSRTSTTSPSPCRRRTSWRCRRTRRTSRSPT